MTLTWTGLAEEFLNSSSDMPESRTVRPTLDEGSSSAWWTAGEISCNAPQREMLLQALWMLTGLSAVVLATLSGHSRRGRAGLTVSFLLSALWCLRFAPPSPEAAGLATAAAAVVLLVRPGTAWIPPVLGGWLGGAWVALLAGQGAPVWLAVPAGAAWLAVPAWLAPRPGFAPPHLRDEALLLSAVFGIAVATLPGVTDGWQAALGLSLQTSQASPGAAIPAWALGIGVSSIALGALSSMWSRR